MSALLDVNVLIALFDSDHVSHQIAIGWFTAHAKEGWASCPLTENGFVRVMSNPAYPNPLPIDSLIKRLAEASHQPMHEFWADGLSLLDSKVFDSTRMHGPRQITDVYLLGLAVKHKGKLVTFDAGIPLAAVREATAKNLEVL